MIWYLFCELTFLCEFVNGHLCVRESSPGASRGTPKCVVGVVGGLADVRGHSSTNNKMYIINTVSNKQTNCAIGYDKQTSVEWCIQNH